MFSSYPLSPDCFSLGQVITQAKPSSPHYTANKLDCCTSVWTWIEFLFLSFTASTFSLPHCGLFCSLHPAFASHISVRRSLACSPTAMCDDLIISHALKSHTQQILLLTHGRIEARLFPGFRSPSYFHPVFTSVFAVFQELPETPSEQSLNTLTENKTHVPGSNSGFLSYCRPTWAFLRNL